MVRAFDYSIRKTHAGSIRTWLLDSDFFFIHVLLAIINIQVEKTLEMKKSRNGKVIKQGRNVYEVLAM